MTKWYNKKMAEKISSGKIDSASPLYAFEGSGIISEIDPSILRIVRGATINAPYYLVGGASGGSGNAIPEPEDPSGEDPVTPVVGELAKLFPQPGDISIKSQVIDYTQDPPTVTVTLRVKNSTGYDVVGILGRVPRK